jgi:hypothetical protein
MPSEQPVFLTDERCGSDRMWSAAVPVAAAVARPA